MNAWTMFSFEVVVHCQVEAKEVALCDLREMLLHV